MGSSIVGWFLTALAILLLWRSGRADWLWILLPLAIVVTLWAGNIERKTGGLSETTRKSGRLG